MNFLDDQNLLKNIPSFLIETGRSLARTRVLPGLRKNVVEELNPAYEALQSAQQTVSEEILKLLESRKVSSESTAMLKEEGK